MRITAGRWKGRALEAPASARPTSERARQALFDILGGRVAGAYVLELYAGSGAVGLEALSRGAARVVFVEIDDEALRRTLSRLRPAAGEVEVLARPAATALAALARAGERFDVVFADPPYGLDPLDVDDALDRAAALLRADGVVVVQRDAKAEPPTPAGLRAIETRPYGRNVFHFYGML